MADLSVLRPLLPHLPLRYVIAGRYRMICEGVRALLEEQCPDLQCVACVSDGSSLFRTLCLRKPDLLLSGMSLEGVPTQAVFRQYRQCLPQMGLIALLVSDQTLAVAEAAQAGAHAAVRISDGGEQLLETVFRVAIGQRGLLGARAALHGKMLSGKERKVFCGIISCLPTAKIASETGLGIKMVELYRSRLLRRFKVRKSIDLVRIACESGIDFGANATDYPLCPLTARCGRCNGAG